LDKEPAIIVGEPHPDVPLTAQYNELMSERRVPASSRLLDFNDEARIANTKHKSATIAFPHPINVDKVFGTHRRSSVA
jgi:hypothetical protein